MRLPADIVFEPDIIAHLVGEPRLPIARVVVRIVHGDDDLELGRAYLADSLGRDQLVGVWRAGGVKERFFVEAEGRDNKRVALVFAVGMAVVIRERDQLLVLGRGL